jgi:hypothetical protein
MERHLNPRKHDELQRKQWQQSRHATTVPCAARCFGESRQRATISAFPLK